jgi:hypothetical protein
MKPLCIDLFCGLGGWADGFLAEGYRVVGFDIERHDYGTGGYPGQLVIQDVLTLHGSQFRDAAVIVASAPCQEYSYMAMPWSHAKAKADAYRAHPENQKQLTALFDACFRLQREASEAAGRYIPLVAENVCGAQKWVGRAKWHYGSFYLWGDVPALMPMAGGIKNGSLGGGSWFGIAHSNDPRDAHLRGDGLKFGGDWWHDSKNNLIRKASSKSGARKAASAQIAKIPFPLAQYIAEVYMPRKKRSHEL